MTYELTRSMAYIMLGRKRGAYANAWCSTHRQGFDNPVRGEMQVPTQATPIGGRGAPLRVRLCMATMARCGLYAQLCVVLSCTAFAHAAILRSCAGLQRDSGGVVLARVLCANGYWAMWRTPMLMQLSRLAQARSCGLYNGRVHNSLLYWCCESDMRPRLFAP